MSSESAATSTLFLGHSGEWWDTWLIVSVVCAAVAAIAIGVTTAGSIVTHSREAQAAEERAAKLAVALEQAQNNAKQIDANLLREQRLTSNERWRLRRIERAVLPRTAFIDMSQLVVNLKAGHFAPINLAVPSSPAEALSFGLFLRTALDQAGLLKGFVLLSPSTSEFVPSASGGAILLRANDRADRLTEMLWQKYGIASASDGFLPHSMPPEWASIPQDENCLVVLENGAAMGGSPGQDGEGLNEHGRLVPPP